MTGRATRLVLMLVCWVVAVFHASAQEPAPPLPRPDTPIEPRQPVPPASGTSPSPPEELDRVPSWTSSLSLSAGYDSNVDLLPTDLGRGDGSGRVHASVKRRFGGRDWQALLQADGGVLVYRDLSDYNALPFGVRLGADSGSSKGNLLSTSLDYRHDYLRNNARFVESGIVADNVLASTTTATIGLRGGLVSRVGVVTDAAYQRVSFEDDVRPTGDTLSLGAGLEWTPREADRVNLRYLHRRERSDGSPGSHNHEVRISWDRRLTRTLDTAVFAGLGRATLLADQLTVISPSAGLRLDGRHGRHEVAASYEHSFGQAYGLGRSLFFDSVSVHESYRMTPRWSVFVKGSLSRGHDPADAAYRLDGEGASAALSYRVSPRCMARAAYSYWTRRDTGQPAFASNVLELVLMYERSSRGTASARP